MTRAKDYFSLIKFSHTVFAMPFAIIGFFLGTHSTSAAIDFSLFLKVIACMVLARTSAMAFNRFIDRSYDSINVRTKSREIPSGKMKPKQALLLTILSGTVFIAATFFINPLCFKLAPVALAVVLGYSYTKRFTALCHFILGIGLSLAPIGAYLAVTGRFDTTPLLFSMAVITWVSGFDIIYALQDDEFDRSQQLHSVPVLFGRKNSLMFSRLLHVLSFSLIVIAGWLGGFGNIYWVGSGIFGFLLVYQHSIIRPDDLSRVNMAFFTTNGIASVIFSVFVVADLLLS